VIVHELVIVRSNMPIVHLPAIGMLIEYLIWLIGMLIEYLIWLIGMRLEIYNRSLLSFRTLQKSDKFQLAVKMVSSMPVAGRYIKL
jgi:hypothetical protein